MCVVCVRVESGVIRRVEHPKSISGATTDINHPEARTPDRHSLANGNAANCDRRLPRNGPPSPSAYARLYRPTESPEFAITVDLFGNGFNLILFIFPRANRSNRQDARTSFVGVQVEWHTAAALYFAHVETVDYLP